MQCPMACTFLVTRKYPYLVDKLTEHRKQEALDFSHRTAYLSCAFRLREIGADEEAEAMELMAKFPKFRKLLTTLLKTVTKDG